MPESREGSSPGVLPSRRRVATDGRGSGILRRIAARCGLVLVSLIFTLGLLEGAFRLLGLFPPVAYHVLPPHTEARDVQTGWDIVYRTNSLGLRDDEHPLAKADRPRIVLIGDSFAFGQGIERREAFPAVLQHLLEERGCPAEVINASNIGLGAEGYYVLLKDIAIAYRPDVVVVNAFGNDASDGRTTTAAKRLLRDLSHVSHVFSFLRVANKRLANRRSAAVFEDEESFWRRVTLACAERAPAEDCSRRVREFRERHNARVNNLAAACLADPDEVRRWVYTDPQLEVWKSFETYAESMAGLCRRRGIPLVLALVPDGVQVDPQQVSLRRSLGVAYPDAVLTDEGPFQALAGGVARRLGLPLYDPLDRFRRVREGLYFEDDLHWTAAGHRLYAEGLAETLLSGGFVCAGRTSSGAVPRSSAASSERVARPLSILR